MTSRFIFSILMINLWHINTQTINLILQTCTTKFLCQNLLVYLKIKIKTRLEFYRYRLESILCLIEKYLFYMQVRWKVPMNLVSGFSLVLCVCYVNCLYLTVFCWWYIDIIHGNKISHESRLNCRYNRLKRNVFQILKDLKY